MVNGIRTGDPRGFNKRCSLKFCVGSPVRQTPEEGQRTYRLKRCGNNNKDEENSPKTLNDKNHQASSQKFRQLIMSCYFDVWVILLIPTVSFIYRVDRTLAPTNNSTKIPNPRTIWLSSRLGCRIHWLHLCRGVRPHPMNVLYMTLNSLMVRSQWWWSFGECREPLHCHCSQVHSGLAW